MLPGKQLKPEDLLRALRRGKWLVIVPFLLTTMATVLVSAMLPDRYRSETLVLVVPQGVPESFVRSTVTTRLDDRLRSIHQKILSRTNLEKIIRDTDLYPEMRKRFPMEDVVERMRADVRVEMARGDAFRVAFTSQYPKQAMDVAGRLTSLFLDESAQDREDLADATSNFLEGQLVEARRRLVAAEVKVADFQRKYAGALPSERDANLTAMHNLELQLQTLLDSANRERDRRLFLERTLADLEAEAQAARSVASSSAFGDMTGPVAGNSPADQLEAARRALKGLELRLKPEHPDILYMKRVIRDLEAKIAAEAVPAKPAADPGAKSAAPPAERAARPPTAAEAAAVRRIQETRDELTNLQVGLASKAADEKRLRDQIARYQARVALAPGLQADFTSMTRDYETLRRGYETLLAKSEDAKAAAVLESRQIGEKFDLLDPARLPESPISPNRPAHQPGRRARRPRPGLRSPRAAAVSRQRAAVRGRRLGGAEAPGAGGHSLDRDKRRSPAAETPPAVRNRRRFSRRRRGGRLGAPRLGDWRPAVDPVVQVDTCTRASSDSLSGHSI